MNTPIPQVQKLADQLSEQWHSFMKRMAHLRHRLDFARDHYYLTQEAEPVFTVLDPGVAWTVQGRYGPTLVSRNLPIWDADAPPARPQEQEAVIATWRTSLMDALESSGHRFRVYETKGGIRVICTSRTMDLTQDADTAWFRQIGQAIKADRAYMVISGRQRCSRARLRPKPPEFRLGPTAFHEPGDQALLELFNRDRTRACRLICTVGRDLVHTDLSEQIDFHDAETEATNSDKELF